jgi:hypothetical protein
MFQNLRIQEQDSALKIIKIAKTENSDNPDPTSSLADPDPSLN